MEEQYLVVLYDIQIDRLRTKISEACLDYGLERIQFSAFRGKLTRNKREELFLRLTTILEDTPGKILVQPICEKDFKAARSVENESMEEESGESAPEKGET
ncbi:MAG TPA: CRISPR-associated endonuclease Cas2 [Methylomirabilota bacterium]|jgi:CRISPR-associated protein Cas2|nr:CRISPR-associated endonuclease Cas2 [Methylomirabilota bacterium]